jgi:hypothetical protein
MPLRKKPTIAVFGGRADAIHVHPAVLRLYASGRFGGAGDARRLIDALSAGQVDGLVLWARFTGHSDGDRLLRTAARNGVPTRVVLGGRTSLILAIRALSQGGDA